MSNEVPATYTLKIHYAAAPEAGARDFYVYQKSPPAADALIWLLQSAVSPGVELSFGWGDDYWFVWKTSDPLGATASVDEWQFVHASLTDVTRCQIELDYTDGAYLFGPRTLAEAEVGTLYLHTGENVGMAEPVWAGIGRSGKALWALPAEPNLTYEFTPAAPSTYWLVAAAAGTRTEGAVVPDDDAELASCQVTFPDMVTQVTMTFDGATWSTS